MTELREATEDDAPAVESVWEAVAAEGEWIGTELPLRPDWQDRFRNAIADPAMHWFVVTVDVDRIVGAIFVGHEQGVGHLGMAILDRYRGQGLGRELLAVGVDWIVRQDCHKVVLEVWPHNERARGLYESMGFVVEGRLRRHYRRANGSLWDALAMGLVLDERAPGRDGGPTPPT